MTAIYSWKLLQKSKAGMRLACQVRNVRQVQVTSHFNYLISTFYSTTTKELVTSVEHASLDYSNRLDESVDWRAEMRQIRSEENISPLAHCSDDISHYAPNLRPSFNFAAYVNESATLQELVKLGVNLHKLEKKKNAPELILRLHFERDIRKYLFFLHDHGVPTDKFGYFLTKNPFILSEDLDLLKTRVEYLQSKKFSPLMISKVISGNPHWLMFSTQRIDRRLGHFQKEFSLLGKEVRKLAIIQPRLITYNMEHIKLNTFAIREEMGFSAAEIKSLLMKKPKLWMLDQLHLVERFQFVHNTMKIPIENIYKMPEILLCRKSRIRERHLFLMKLNRAQYDPRKENYVSMKDIVSGNDVEFCTHIAKTTPTVYNTFLKTL